MTGPLDSKPKNSVSVGLKPPPPPATPPPDLSQKASPAPPPPPNPEELKKILAEVKSFGVQMPKDLLDEKGNLQADKIAEAKKYLVAEAGKRAKGHLGGAARLYEKALQLDPADKALRLKTAQVKFDAALATKDSKARMQTLSGAAELLAPLLQAEPKNWQALHLQGNILKSQGNNDEARRVLEKAYHEAISSKASEEQQHAIITVLKAAGYREGPWDMKAPEEGPMDTRRPAFMPMSVAIDRMSEGTDQHMEGVDTTYFVGVDYSRAHPVGVDPLNAQLMKQLKAKGVLDLEVRGNDEKTPLPALYRKYAFAHYQDFKKEIEAVYGELPFKPDGTVTPAFQKAYDKSLESNRSKIQNILEQKKLKPGTPEYDKAFKEELAKPEYELLRNAQKICDPKVPFNDKAVLFFKFRADQHQQDAGKILLGAALPGDSAKAISSYIKGAEAWERAFAFSSDPKDMKKAAQAYYAGAVLARQNGDEAQAKKLFLRGVAVLQSREDSEMSRSLIQKDGEAFKMIADGWREAGLYKEAVQCYDQAWAAGLILPANTSKFEAVAKNQEFRDSLKVPVEYSKRQHDIGQKIGEGFFNRVGDLEKKQAEGKISKQEAEELKLMQQGQALLKRTNRVNFPAKAGAPEPATVIKAREEVAESLKMPIDAGKLAAAQKSVERLEKSAQSFSMVQQAGLQFLSNYPAYVQEHVKQTGDWSVVRLSYAGATDLPAGWNAEALNDLPILKAYREMKQRDPEAAKQLLVANGAFQNAALMPGQAKDQDTLEADAAKLTGFVFQTDPKTGKLPLDPRSGEPKYEGIPALNKLLKEDLRLKIQTNPVLEARNGIEESSKNLQQIKPLLLAMTQAKAQLSQLEAQLKEAKQAGKTEAIQKLTQQIEQHKKQMAKAGENAKKLIAEQGQQLRGKLENYPGFTSRAKLRDYTNQGPFQDEVAQANGDLLRISVMMNQSPDPNADPVAAFDAALQGLQGLAGAHGVYMKACSMADAAFAHGWSGPYWHATNTWDSHFGPEDLKKALAGTGLEDWQKRKADLKPGQVAFSLDAAGIDKCLKGLDGYLRQQDQEMFKDLPKTLKEGIDAQIQMLEDMKKAKQNALGGEHLAGGTVELREYDLLILKYLQAKKALESGNLSRALNLFQLATDSKNHSSIKADFEKFQKVEGYKTLALEVAIITAVTIMTAGTLSILAPEAMAAVSMGTATTGQVLGVALGEAALFVAYEKGMKGFLFYHANYGQNPLQDEKGNWLMPWDYGWEVAKMAMMLKFLHQAGSLYQAWRLEGKVMSDLVAKATVEEAMNLSPQLGRAALRQQMEAQVAQMSIMGKAGYHAGGFATEAAAMQVWTNLAALMDTMYQNTVHDKKLSWTDEIDKANSPEAMEHGLAMLAGLKLGGLAAKPITETVSAKTAKAQEKIQRTLKAFENFSKDTAAWQKRLTDPNFQMEGKSRRELIDLINQGDGVYDAKSPDGKALFSADQQAEWQETRQVLLLLTGQSAARDQALKTSFSNGASIYPDPANPGKFLRTWPGAEKPVDASRAEYDLYAGFEINRAEQSVLAAQKKSAELNKGFDAGDVVYPVPPAKEGGEWTFSLQPQDPAKPSVPVDAATHQVYVQWTLNKFAEAQKKKQPPPLPREESFKRYFVDFDHGMYVMPIPTRAGTWNYLLYDGKNPQGVRVDEYHYQAYSAWVDTKIPALDTKGLSKSERQAAEKNLKSGDWVYPNRNNKGEWEYSLIPAAGGEHRKVDRATYVVFKEGLESALAPAKKAPPPLPKRAAVKAGKVASPDADVAKAAKLATRPIDDAPGVTPSQIISTGKAGGPTPPPLPSQRLALQVAGEAGAKILGKKGVTVLSVEAPADNPKVQVVEVKTPDGLKLKIEVPKEAMGTEDAADLHLDPPSTSQTDKLENFMRNTGRSADPDLEKALQNEPKGSAQIGVGRVLDAIAASDLPADKLPQKYRKAALALRGAKAELRADLAVGMAKEIADGVTGLKVNPVKLQISEADGAKAKQLQADVQTQLEGVNHKLEQAGLPKISHVEVEVGSSEALSPLEGRATKKVYRVTLYDAEKNTVGFIEYGHAPDLYGQKTLYLDKVQTLGPYRGQGIAGILDRSVQKRTGIPADKIFLDAQDDGLVVWPAQGYKWVADGDIPDTQTQRKTAGLTWSGTAKLSTAFDEWATQKGWSPDKISSMKSSAGENLGAYPKEFIDDVVKGINPRYQHQSVQTLFLKWVEASGGMKAEEANAFLAKQGNNPKSYPVEFLKHLGKAAGDMARGEDILPAVPYVMQVPTGKAAPGAKVIDIGKGKAGDAYIAKAAKPAVFPVDDAPEVRASQILPADRSGPQRKMPADIQAKDLLPFTTERQPGDPTRQALENWTKANSGVWVEPANRARLIQDLQGGKKVFTIDAKGKAHLEDAAAVKQRMKWALEVAPKPTLGSKTSPQELKAQQQALMERAAKRPGMSEKDLKAEIADLLSEKSQKELQENLGSLPQPMRDEITLRFLRGDISLKDVRLEAKKLQETQQPSAATSAGRPSAMAGPVAVLVGLATFFYPDIAHAASSAGALGESFMKNPSLLGLGLLFGVGVLGMTFTGKEKTEPTPKGDTVKSPFPNFQKTVDRILANTPPERQPEARKALEDAFVALPKDAPPKDVGTALKKIEADFVPKTEAAPVVIPANLRGVEGPNVAKLSQAEVDTLASLQTRGIIDEAITRQLMEFSDIKRVKDALASAQGSLDKADKGEIETGKPHPLISAYTGIRGLLFEAATAERGKKLPGADPADPSHGKKVRIDFKGLKDGQTWDYSKSAVDNDVPIIPGRIWEAKRYPRLDFGSTDPAVNQILKYQKAIDEGHFEAATVEIGGNVDPAFLKALRSGEIKLSDGNRLVVNAPNVEVLYHLTLPTGREVVIPLKTGNPPEGSKQQSTSLRHPPFHELSPAEQKIVLGVERALAEGKYELFSGKTLSEADIAGSSKEKELKAALADGKIDPKLISDIDTFKAFEKILGEKRLKAFGELGKDLQVGFNADPTYAGFKAIRVTKVDDTKPWKPPLEVEVIRADGTTETIPANTPFYRLVTPDGRLLTVSAAAAEHIDRLHIKATDAGSHFDYPSVEAFLKDAVGKIPSDAATAPGPYSFSIPMGRPMGKEGIASVAELKASGHLSDGDIDTAKGVRQRVQELNLKGTPEEKQAFIEEFKKAHPDCKIQFQLVRGKVLVPVVDAPKQDTQNLFMVFGPTEQGGKELWTAAPGRFMPKHPDAGQHSDAATGKVNEKTFKESSEAWFDTVMLTGKAAPDKVSADKVADQGIAGLQGSNYAKLSVLDQNAGANLKAAGVLSPEMEQALDNYMKAPGTETRVASGLKTAHGYLKAGDSVSAYTALKGLLFELSRRDTVNRMLGGDAGPAAVSRGPKIKYDGLKMGKSADPTKAGPVISVVKGSEVQIDVPVIQGHIHEVKSYPRRTVGDGSFYLAQFLNGEKPAGEIPKDLVGIFNQALKYQAALKQHPELYKAATIEIEGNIDKGFLALLQKFAPDVEVLCRMPLPNGQEVVFRVKGGGEGRESLARRPAFNKLTPQEKDIVDGIRKSVEDGSISDVFRSSLLTQADLNAALKDGKISQAAHDHLISVGLDPTKIKDLEAFKGFEKLTLEKRYQILADKSGSAPSHRKNAWTQSMSPEGLIKEWDTALRQISESNDPIRRQYDFDYQIDRAEQNLAREADPKKKAKLEKEIQGLKRQHELTEQEFKERVKAISDYESTRAAREQADPSIRARREAMGYKGPKEGVPLDSLHIYMDCVKTAKAKFAAQVAIETGKAKPLAAGTKVKSTRSYDAAHDYPTAAQVAGDIKSGKYRETRNFVEVRYPLDLEGTEIDRSNLQVVATTSGALEPKLQEDNVKRLSTLTAKSRDPQDSSIPMGVKKALEMHRKSIDRAEGDLKSLQEEMVQKMGTVQDKGAVRKEFEPKLKAARENLLQTYQKALGDKAYEQFTAKITRQFSDNRVKFIYVIDADGQMRMVQEPLEPGAERPAHSELAGGRNVYAAGEIYIQDGVVTVINNGSGHYRPDAAETFSFVKATLEANGFKVSDKVKPEQVKFPFVPFDDFENNIAPSPFAKEVAPDKVDETKSVDESGDVAVKGTTPGPSMAGPVGVVLGLATLFAPDIAQAADSHAQTAHDAYQQYGMAGLVAVGIGIALGVGIPLLRSRWAQGAPEPPVQPLTREDPLRLENPQGEVIVRPFRIQDRQATDLGEVGKVTEAHVVGDQVEVLFQGTEVQEKDSKVQVKDVPKTAQTLSKDQARRLGIKFDKEGNVSELPKGEFLLTQFRDNPPISKAARTAAEISGDSSGLKTVAAIDQGGNASRLQPLSVHQGPLAKDDPQTAYGKVNAVAPDPKDPKQIQVGVAVYDPADPQADPQGMSFGLGSPQVVEQRTFTMTRGEAERLGVLLPGAKEPFKVPVNQLLLITDEAATQGGKASVVISNSPDSGQLIIPANRLPTRRVMMGRFAVVDPASVSRQGDKVYFFFKEADLPGRPGKRIGAEPLAMTLAEARQIGITFGKDNRVRITRNEFIMSEVHRKPDGKITVEGKDLQDDAPLSIREVKTADGKLHLEVSENPQTAAPDAALPKDAAYGAAGPVAIFTALSAAAVDPKIAAVAAGVGIFLTPGVLAGVLIWMGWRPAKPPALEVRTRGPAFSVAVDSEGRLWVPEDNTGDFIRKSNPGCQFEFGADGRWYVANGKPNRSVVDGRPYGNSAYLPSTERVSVGPDGKNFQALPPGYWLPVKDGDIVRIGDRTFTVKLPVPEDMSKNGYAPHPYFAADAQAREAQEQARQAAQKQELKAQTLKAGQDKDAGVSTIPPTQLAAWRDSRQHAREAIFDKAFDQAPPGSPLSVEQIIKTVEETLDVLEILRPGLEKLSLSDRGRAEGAIESRILEGKLTKAQAQAWADRISTGEFSLVPIQGPEGFQIQQTPRTGTGVTRVAPLSLPSDLSAEPLMAAGVIVREANSGTAEWSVDLNHATTMGKDFEAQGKAVPEELRAEVKFAQEVQAALGRLKGTAGDLLTAKKQLTDLPAGPSEKRNEVEGGLRNLQTRLKQDLAIVERWRQYPGERAKLFSAMSKVLTPFQLKAAEWENYQLGKSQKKPTGVEIVDAEPQGPHPFVDIQTGPGKTSGDYQVVLTVKNQADGQKVLEEIKNNPGTNQVRPFNDVKGTLQALEMITPEGQVFTVRWEVPSKYAKVMWRQGIADSRAMRQDDRPLPLGRADDPAKVAFMEGQRQEAGKLVERFKKQVNENFQPSALDPVPRPDADHLVQMFQMDLGKLMNEDAAGLPVAGAGDVEEFRADRTEKIEALARKFGLDRDPNFLGEAKKLLIDNVVAHAPRVEPGVTTREAKARIKWGQTVWRGVYEQILANKKLTLGLPQDAELDAKSADEVMETLEKAREAFVRAGREGKTLQEARTLALQTLGPEGGKKTSVSLPPTIRAPAMGGPDVSIPKQDALPGNLEVLPPPPSGKMEIPPALKALGPLAVGLGILWPGAAEAAPNLTGHANSVADAYVTGGWVLAAATAVGILVGVPLYLRSRGSPGAGSTPPQGAPSVSQPLPAAVSGSLPVGQYRSVTPHPDGRLFVIGRGQGDLQFSDGSVSRVHCSISKDPATGHYYLTDGAYGDPKRSATGVLVRGEVMTDKVAELHDGDIFTINGANFQFRAPQTPVVRLSPQAPSGVPEVKLQGRRYSVGIQKKTGAPMGGSILGEILEVSPNPGDPQGRVSLTLRTTQALDSPGQSGGLVLQLTPQEAQALGLKLTSDGRLDPGQRGDQIRFSPILEGQQTAVPLAADQVAAQTPVAKPPPLPPKAKTGGTKLPWAMDGRSGNQEVVLGRSKAGNYPSFLALKSGRGEVVSRQHARLIATPDGKYFLSDLSGKKGGVQTQSHGTWILEGKQWRKLGSQDTELKPGQSFALGTLGVEKKNIPPGGPIPADQVNLQQAEVFALGMDGKSIFPAGPEGGIPPPPPPPQQITPFVASLAVVQDGSALAQADLKNFNKLGKSLVGKVPGLTRELESLFREGVTIQPTIAYQPGETLVKRDRFIKIVRLSGADTIISLPAKAEEYRVYQAWRAKLGFGESDGQGGGRKALQELGGKLGIQFAERMLADQQAEYIAQILQTLPPTFFSAQSPEGHRYLRSIRLGSGRVGIRGAAMDSAFKGDTVYLYSGALEGPRRNLMGLLLHELGHSTANRYALSREENHGETPPDSGIPADVRKQMHLSFDVLRNKGALYGLDWMGGKESRKEYTAMSFGEFIAEFHLHYVADGPGLRAHIASLRDPQARAAYQSIYDELKTRAFAGREYGI